MFEINRTPIPTLFGYAIPGEFSAEKEFTSDLLRHVHAALPVLLLLGTCAWIVHRKNSRGMSQIIF
jgi:hypothetical protein